ncbi:MAG: hypothetical protein ACI3YZ_05635, partial [Prevotella sp.]
AARRCRRQGEGFAVLHGIAADGEKALQCCTTLPPTGRRLCSAARRCRRQGEGFAVLHDVAADGEKALQCCTTFLSTKKEYFCQKNNFCSV